MGRTGMDVEGKQRRRLPVVQSAREIPTFGSNAVARWGATGIIVDRPELREHRGEIRGAVTDGVDVEISLVKPLPLVEERFHRLVGAKHVWIGVREGIVVVLSGTDHLRFERLANGATIADLVASGDTREAVTDLVGRLVGAGFLRGVDGYTAHQYITPHRFARLHLTKQCQLECVHCYAESGPYVSREGELTVERWHEIIDAIAACGGERLLFTGGEALVYRGCLDLMRHAKMRGLHVTLFSNGILIPRYIDDLKNCVDQVQISVDGIDAVTHDQIRGTGSFLKAIRAIRALLDAKISVRLGMTVMEKNWSSIRDGFLTFAKEYENTDLEYRLGYGVSTHGRGGTLDDKLTVEQTREIVDGFLAQVQHETKPIAQRTIGCGYAEQLVIGPDGMVYPCHLLDGELGNISERPLGDVLTYLFDTAAAFDVDHVEGCRTCEIRYLCGGSCRVKNGRVAGSRLVTTCSASEKDEKYQTLARTFAP